MAKKLSVQEFSEIAQEAFDATYPKGIEGRGRALMFSASLTHLLLKKKIIKDR